MTSHPQRRSTLPTHFCLSIDGLLRLFFIAFGLGYFLILWFSFLLDYLFAYPMCEICLLQRFLMFLIVVSSILGGLVVSSAQRLGYVFLCANGLLVGLGLAFAVAHLHMMQTVTSGGASACQVVSEMAFIPDFLSEYFHAHYAFVPCDQVKSGFLGLSFPMWSLLIYGASAIVFSLVVYLVVTQFRSRSFVARIREARWFAWCRLVFTMVLVILFCVWISASIYVIMNQRNIIYRPERYTTHDADLLKYVDVVDYTLDMGPQQAYAFSSQKHIPKHKAQADTCKLWIVLSGRDAVALNGYVGKPYWRRLFEAVTSDAQVLLIDYPGFGANAGSPTEKANRDSVLAAHKAWREQRAFSATQSCQVYLLAHSMGTGVAVDVARSLPDVHGVVLLSPFLSIHDMVKGVLGGWMAWTVWPFLWDRYPTVDRLADLHQAKPQVPLAIFHGDQDFVIPVWHSQNMVKTNRWIDYHQVSGLGHSKDGFADHQLLLVMQRMMGAAAD